MQAHRNMPTIGVLQLQENEWTGTLPSELGTLSSLGKCDKHAIVFFVPRCFVSSSSLCFFQLHWALLEMINPSTD